MKGSGKDPTNDTMTHYVCTTCGTQYAAADTPPEACAICTEERQYVGWNGQSWTTHEQLRKSHKNSIRQEEPGLISLGMEPSFAIGQRAFLVTHPAGNILWDCIPLLDDALIGMVKNAGGLAAIAISHPHYYSGMVEWSRAFDCPILLHADDRQWVMRPDPAIEFWEGETRDVGGGRTLIRCGGHYDGGCVMHCPDGADGAGALLTGDIIQVVQDRRWVSFMYSYPNFIPLSAAKVDHIVTAVEPYDFDRIYGAFWGKVVPEDAKAAVSRSAERYVRALEAE